MNYNEVQIRQADTALKMLHDAQGFVDGHQLWQAMGPPKAEYMRYQLSEVLHLASRRIDRYTITEEGDRAYEMGFKAYMEERERKAAEPIAVKEITDNRPWYKPNKRELLQAIIASVVGTLVGALISRLLS